jgi:1,4-dihydroxy-2-naphthoate octaprenyltransferase
MKDSGIGVMEDVSSHCRSEQLQSLGMTDTSMQRTILTLLRAARPQYLAASVAPVLVGSALGFSTAGGLHALLFVLALLAMMALHAGANVTNDYFDHTTENDWINKNPTPFSGGSRFIQREILSPQATLWTGLAYLGIGCGIGLLIVWLTRSSFVLGIGLAGAFGAFFYTAWPLRLGYRGVGEIIIGILFGILPVYGSYYLQSRAIDILPILPALIVAILIFLVILINEFPDLPADAQVHKNTLVVLLGVPRAAFVYRATLAVSYVLAGLMLLNDRTFYAGLLYLLTLPLAIFAMRSANSEDLVKPGLYRANQLTIVLHTVGSLSLAAGLLVPGWAG